MQRTFKRAGIKISHTLAVENMAPLYFILVQFTLQMQELFNHFLVEKGHRVVQLEHTKPA